MRELTDIKEIQSICLNILKFIDEICQKNDIKWSLSAGSALGAIRHKGFIPWDDDIDIMMTRENYNKFLKVMEKNDNPRFSFTCYPNSIHFFIKVYDTNTIVESPNIKQKNPAGIAVDIFPIDVMNPKTVKKDLLWTNRYHGLAYLASTEKFIKDPAGFLPSVKKFVYRAVAKFFGVKFWIRRADKIKTKYNSTDCNLAGVFDEYLEGEIFDRKLFDNIIMVDFEGCKFPIVAEYDKYLSGVYGDYMTPPPKDKQVAHLMKAYIKTEDK